MEKDVKQCPHCGETIMAAAKKCRYCGTWLDGNTPADHAAKGKVRKEYAARRSGYIVLGVCCAILVVVTCLFFALKGCSDDRDGLNGETDGAEPSEAMDSVVVDTVAAIGYDEYTSDESAEEVSENDFAVKLASITNMSGKKAEAYAKANGYSDAGTVDYYYNGFTNDPDYYEGTFRKYEKDGVTIFIRLDESENAQVGFGSEDVYSECIKSLESCGYSMSDHGSGARGSDVTYSKPGYTSICIWNGDGWMEAYSIYEVK